MSGTSCSTCPLFSWLLGVTAEFISASRLLLHLCSEHTHILSSSSPLASKQHVHCDPQLQIEASRAEQKKRYISTIHNETTMTPKIHNHEPPSFTFDPHSLPKNLANLDPALSSPSPSSSIR